MSGFFPPINEVVDTNIIISTTSAIIIAEQFKPSPLEFWLPFVTSAAAAFAAVMSFFASKKTADLSHEIFLNELNKEYSAIGIRLFEEYHPKLPLSNKNKLSMCNFFEKICELYHRKLIKRFELSRYNADLFNKDFMEYAIKRNKTDKVLGEYVKWLEENNKL